MRKGESNVAPSGYGLKDPRESRFFPGYACDPPLSAFPMQAATSRFQRERRTGSSALQCVCVRPPLRSVTEPPRTYAYGGVGGRTE